MQITVAFAFMLLATACLRAPASPDSSEPMSDPGTSGPTVFPSAPDTDPIPGVQPLPSPAVAVAGAAIGDLQWRRIGLPDVADPRARKPTGWGWLMGSVGGCVYGWGENIVVTCDGIEWSALSPLPTFPVVARTIGGRLVLLEDKDEVSPDGQVVGHHMEVWTSSDGSAWVKTEIPSVAADPPLGANQAVELVGGEDPVVVLGSLSLSELALLGDYVRDNVGEEFGMWVEPGKVVVNCGALQRNTDGASRCVPGSEELSIPFEVEVAEGRLEIRYQDRASGREVASVSIELPEESLQPAASLLAAHGRAPLVWLITTDGAVDPVGSVIPDALDVRSLERAGEDFVAMGYTSVNELAVWTSTDGRTWLRVQSPFPPDWSVGETLSTGDRMVAQVSDSSDSPRMEQWTTIDGLAWTHLPEFGFLRLAHGEIGWVASEPDGSQIWFSPDGGDWQPLRQVVSNPDIADGLIQSVAVGSQFMAIWSIGSTDFGPGWLWVGAPSSN